MRGNPGYSTFASTWRGSIPAYAGEPLQRPLRFCWAPVYPRVCGGTAVGDSVPNASEGLSPRMRGNPGYSTFASTWRGSIPAYAGEPLQRPLRFCWAPVYPRVCGGTGGQLREFQIFRGLSPRMRGNRT